MVMVAGAYTHHSSESGLVLIGGTGFMTPYMLYAMAAGAVLVTEPAIASELAALGLQVGRAACPCILVWRVPRCLFPYPLTTNLSIASVVAPQGEVGCPRGAFIAPPFF